MVEVPEIEIFPKFTLEPSTHLSIGEDVNVISEPVKGVHPNCQFEAVLNAVELVPTQVYVLFTVINAFEEFVDVQDPLVTTAL